MSELPVSPLSRSQVQKLGRRLRESEPPTVEDLELLEQLRRAYRAAMVEVESVLLDHGFMPTVRLKTTQTIIGKLRRNPTMALSRMQDIAGARIVGDFGLHEQDAVSEKIAGRFHVLQVVDRRARPSHGYRAVHVVVEAQGRPVEIQVRTRMQDHWAQMFERLADRWGRQIRYGEPPTEPLERTRVGPSRQEVVSQLQGVSETIFVVEDASRLIEAMKRQVEQDKETLSHLLGTLASVLELGPPYSPDRST